MGEVDAGVVEIVGMKSAVERRWLAGHVGWFGRVVLSHFETGVDGSQVWFRWQ